MTERMSIYIIYIQNLFQNESCRSKNCVKRMHVFNWWGLALELLVINSNSYCKLTVRLFRVPSCKLLVNYDI